MRLKILLKLNLKGGGGILSMFFPEVSIILIQLSIVSFFCTHNELKYQYLRENRLITVYLFIF